MIVEILFNEVCSLSGDSRNAFYLLASLPEAEFHFTSLHETPFFVEREPNLILIGNMTEKTQRKVIEKLLPYKERIAYLVQKGVVFLATGNACEIFTKEIHYVTEKITTPALGFFDLNVETDYFRRYNGKVMGKFENFTILGFRSQFSFIYGDNSSDFFLRCQRGIGINPDSRFEGMRKNSLFCTQCIGPILPLNPDFCRYIIELAGEKVRPAFYEAAMAAYKRRLGEFSDKHVKF